MLRGRRTAADPIRAAVAKNGIVTVAAEHLIAKDQGQCPFVCAVQFVIAFAAVKLVRDPAIGRKRVVSTVTDQRICAVGRDPRH